MNFEDGNVFFIKTNKAFITHPVACEFSSCNSHKHKSYDDLKILSKKVTFFSGSGKGVVDLALGSDLPGARGSHGDEDEHEVSQGPLLRLSIEQRADTEHGTEPREQVRGEATCYSVRKNLVQVTQGRLSSLL